MRFKSMMRAWVGASFCVGVSLAASTANASGYLTARFGSDFGGPEMANPFAIYYNPAALGGMSGTQIVGDLTAAERSVRYTRTYSALTPGSQSQLTDPAYQRANVGTAKLDNVLALPFVGIASDLGTKDFRVGFASYVPFGGTATWGKNDAVSGDPSIPGAVSGVQRWHDIDASLVVLYNTLAVAYRIADTGLSVGITGSLVYTSLKDLRARNTDGSDSTNGFNGGLEEGRARLDVSRINAAGSVGLYWENKEQSLRVGLAYLSQPGFGEQRLKGKLTQQFGTSAALVQPGDADLIQALPDMVRLGIAYRVSKRVELRADGFFIRWSTFDKQCIVAAGADCNLGPDTTTGAPGADQTGGKILANIPREWKNGWGARAGLGLFVTDELELHGSLGFDTNPVPDKTMEVSSYDAFRVYITAGARYAFTPKFLLGLNLNETIFAPVNINNSGLPNYAQTSRWPSGNGHYGSNIFFVNVNALYKF